MHTENRETSCFCDLIVSVAVAHSLDIFPCMMFVNWSLSECATEVRDMITETRCVQSKVGVTNFKILCNGTYTCI